MSESMVECPLSARELEVLQLVATGATNAQIAQKLFISSNTVKVHLRNIFAKLEVESRTEAITAAIRNGWIHIGGEVLPAGEPVAAGFVEEEGARRGWAPLARWQRVLFMITLLCMIAILFLPRPRSASAPAADSFSDQPMVTNLTALRAQASRWISEAQMPTPRARLAVVFCQSKLYAIGGDSEMGIVNVVEEFDPLGNIWRRRAGKPTAVANIGAVAIGGKIYVPGGYSPDRKALDVLEVYDPEEDHWSAASSLPEPLFAYAMAAVGERLYLFGGSNGQRYLATTYVYDTKTDRWEAGTSLAVARGFLAAGVVDDVVYVMGGYDGVTEYALCEAYDPTKEGSGENPWSLRTPMLAGRAGLSAAVVGTNVYAIGGGWNSYLYFNQRYDVVNDVWASFETPVVGQWRTVGAAAVQLGEESVIYAIGGWNGDFLSLNEKYRPFVYVSLPIIP